MNTLTHTRKHKSAGNLDPERNHQKMQTVIQNTIQNNLTRRNTNKNNKTLKTSETKERNR